LLACLLSTRIHGANLRFTDSNTNAPLGRQAPL
jgi:hypothetical protein